MKSPFPRCRTCGKEHALGGCPEFQSTAARKDVHGGGDVIRSSERSVERSGTSSKANPTTDMGIEGTQALPVDTIPKPKKELTFYELIELHQKRLAYQAQYQRDLRAATKLGISVKEFRAGKGKEE